MKKLMFAVVAIAGFAVFAADAEGVQSAGAEAGLRQGPRNRAGMMSERGRFPRGGFGGDSFADPSVGAVMNSRIAEKIGLSEEVRQKLRSIEEDYQKSFRDLNQKSRLAREKQVKLMKEPKIDEAAVMSTIDEIYDSRKALAKVQAKRAISVKTLVTKEQLDKAVSEVRTFRLERRNERKVEAGSVKSVVKPAETSAEASKDK